MEQVIDKQPPKKKEKPVIPMKTCCCRLVGYGVNMLIAEVKLQEDKPLERFAKEAYRSASGSLKRLELPHYKIVVVEPNGTESGYDIAMFR